MSSRRSTVLTWLQPLPLAVSVLLTCAAQITLAEEQTELARDGTTAYVVVRPDPASSDEEFGANELATYLKRVTGATFRVVPESDPDKSPAIYVGNTTFAARQGIDVSGFGPEEWLIRTVGNDVILVGGTPPGVLYAIYEFLERQVGCRWLDEDTEVVPKHTVLRIPQLDVRRKPAFWCRDIYTTTYMYWKASDSWFNIRNKGSRSVPRAGIPHHGSPGACHTFYAYSKDWPENRKECFSLNPRGDRDRATSGSGPGHICMTHPDVPGLVLAKLREFIARDRKSYAGKGAFPRVYDISQNDNNQYICCCDTCKKLEAQEGSASGPLLHMINQVADGIRGEQPNIFVQTFAYTSTQKPPKTIRPRDNVLIRLCDLGSEFGCGRAEYFKPLSHPHNAFFMECLEEWSRVAPHLAIWDYWILYTDPFPSPYVNIAFLQPDIQLFHKHNAETVFVECEKPETSSFFALKRWLGYKLLDDPYQPVEPLLQAFMHGYYGQGAPFIRAYLAYLEQRTHNVPEAMSPMKVTERPYMDLDFFTTVEALLGQAELACGKDAKAALHVRRERIPVDAALLNLWQKLARALDAGQAMPLDFAAVIDRYEANTIEQFQAKRKPPAIEEGKQALQKELARIREIPAIEERRTAPPPSVTVPRVPAPDEGAAAAKLNWDKAAVLAPFLCNTGHETRRRFEARAVHDGVRLYLRLREQKAGMKLTGTEEIWTGDDWEVFFAGTRGEPPYRQLAVNPGGKTVTLHWPALIGKGQSAKWHVPEAKVSSVVEPEQWTVCISLPLASLTSAGVTPGECIYANIYRAEPGLKETFAWSPNFDKGFHVLTRLGELRLEP